MDPPVALSIAGSDSGAGAGIQADLKTFAALGVFGTCAITALTAQNTAAVLGVARTATDFVELQIQAVLADFRVAAVKTGMLATTETIAMVARKAAAGELPNLVVDPVLVSSSGTPLLDSAGVNAYRELLLPNAFVATPNLYEAALLTGRSAGSITDMRTMRQAAEDLASLGIATVVVKGGHLGGSEAPDIVLCRGELAILDARRTATANDHGTGCSLSSAIAARLAWGDDPLEAARKAKSYVTRAIRGASGWRLGAGHGPLDHFGWNPDQAP